MRKVRSAIQRIDVPAIIAALIAESLLFAENVVGWPLLADAITNQCLGGAIGRRHQVGVAFVLNLQLLMKVIHQQRARFAGDL